jgi:hypothetical protein
MSSATQLRQRGLGVQLVLPGAQVSAIGDSLLGIADPLPYGTRKPNEPFRLAPYGTAFVWAPYVDGGIKFHWMPFLLSCFLEMLLSLILGWTVTTVASYCTSTSVGLNALPVALVYAAAIIFGQSWRAAQYLPRHLFPGLTFAETLHTHIGLVVALPYMAMQLAGSAISAPILTALGSTTLPNYATAPRPISFWGAVALQTCLAAFAIYAYLQNTSFKHHHLVQTATGVNASKERRGPNRAFKATSLFFGLAIFLCVMLTYANGLYSVGNFIIEFGALINTGAWNTPDSGYWTLPLLWFFVSGAAGWALHLLTWNVNALSPDEIRTEAITIETEEVTNDGE